jgi:cytidyltransferase-like protein
MVVGYLANSFDLINVRDLDLIAQARHLCSRLVVGVFTDDFAERHQGRRPVVPLVERMALVQRVRGVHEVRVHDDGPDGADPDTLCFQVAGDRPLLTTGRPWLLQPTRETSSAALREALRPDRRVDVA